MNVTGEIGVPIGDARPGGILSTRLTPQLIADAQPLRGAETGDPLRPIGILRFAHGTPVAADEFADPACDHSRIVPR